MHLKSSLKFVGQYLTGIGLKDCEHLDQVTSIEPQTHECADCVSAGAKWVHLRMCMTCGYVGCCETSSLNHMRGHVEESGHPLARSIEGKESWIWCYPHERLVRRRST
jgi:uncharacterized UBP type Zn finger protein